MTYRMLITIAHDMLKIETQREREGEDKQRDRQTDRHKGLDSRSKESRHLTSSSSDIHNSYHHHTWHAERLRPRERERGQTERDRET